MRLHLVDGTFELFRAHFSKRPDRKDPAGRDVKATLGVVSSILALLQEPDERVTHLAVAFDHPVRSFRNDLYEGYKTEEGVPAALLAQFDRVEEAMRAIGVVAWPMDRWEADDAMASAAARWASDVEQVRILTPDKDLGQCIRGDHVVQVDRMRKRVIDEAALLAQRGVLPSSIPDYLALVGDAADGFPGLPGFGEKTAAALLRHYHHLEGIPARAEDWKPNVRGASVLAATLAANQPAVHLYRRLATLVTDVPIRESLEDLQWKGVSAETFDAFCASVDAPEEIRRRAASARRPPNAPSGQAFNL